MIKLLEEAIAKVRDLPEEGQGEATEMLLSVAAKRRGRVALDPETRAAVRRGVDQARRGQSVSEPSTVLDRRVDWTIAYTH